MVAIVTSSLNVVTSLLHDPDGIGHTIDRCFDIVGFPPGIKRISSSIKQGFNANADVKISDKQSFASLSSGFTSEQMQKLLSLINDNTSRSIHANTASRASFFNGNVWFNINFSKYFYANSSLYVKTITLGWIIDSGANQHLTVSTVSMINVVDITSLNITVGHPNGTHATICHAGNLKLSNNVIFYDVLIVPGYSVSLLSVNKLIRDSMMYVGFDEDKCYFQDLKKEKVLGTGSESGGLYLFPNLDLCLFVRSAIWINRHREKDSLSSHKSKDLGELVHMDLWGPYRVPSREGYKYFLIIIDDYSRYVLVYLVKSKDETSCAHTSQQIGIAERKNRYLLNVARSFMFQGGILLKFWSDCILNVVYLINRLSSSILKEYAIETDLINFFDNQTSQRPYDNERARSVLDGSVPSFRHNTDTTLCEEENTSTQIDDQSSSEGNNTHNSSDKHKMLMFLTKKMCRHLLDVNNAFLYGDLVEDVYMTLPEGYNNMDKSKVCKLSKSLYGLKQAPRQWNAKLTTTLAEHDFEQSKFDYSLYVKQKGDVFVALLVYVDDIVITGNDETEIRDFLQFLSTKFLIKDLGVLKYFLRIEILKNDHGLCMSQRKYCLELLHEYGLLDARRVDIPLPKNTILPSQHMRRPLQSRFKAALRVLRYRKSSPGCGIQFYKKSDLKLKAYVDADWAKCPKTRKSVTGFCVFLGKFLVSWKSKKQATLSKSSYKVEYRRHLAVSWYTFIMSMKTSIAIYLLLPLHYLSGLVFLQLCRVQEQSFLASLFLLVPRYPSKRQELFPFLPLCRVPAVPQSSSRFLGLLPSFLFSVYHTITLLFSLCVVLDLGLL
ncbi:ribonuclease H-like domain-containing protein [Tanacetum coccineum]